MKGLRASFVSLVLSSLFFFAFGSATSHGGQGQASSCGELQDIRYPFCLKGGPDTCRDPNYELVCSGNKAFLEILSSNYIVTDILYESATIHLVDVGLESGNCSLPSKSLSASFVLNYYYDNHEGFQMPENWATFFNCSKKIESEIHRPIPCLTQNNRFVYVTFGYGYLAKYLLPSCSYLSMAPMLEANIANSDEEVFQTLRKGFSLSWGRQNYTISTIIRMCLKSIQKKEWPSLDMPGEGGKVVWIPGYYTQTTRIYTMMLKPFILEQNFLECITDHTDFHHDAKALYALSLVVFVLLDTAALVLVIAILVRLILAPLIVYAFLAYELRKIFVKVDTVEKFLRHLQTLMPTRYAHTDLIAMTRHFKEKLGQGGFGSVFKGELPGGHLVAIKMLGNSKCDGEDFISEVSTIGQIHHVNVVRLVGFCSEGSIRALVYEFMCNGSLDKYIFSSNGTKQQFTVEKLNQIALGVARGIDYLHRGCDMRILHFDIKPHNILLDHNFNPKVSDFGLAKLYPRDYSHVSACAARGTIGYMAPELVSRSFGFISYKSDVYSFGMLLLEMAGGRRNVNRQVENSSQVYYPSWIYHQLERREKLEFCNDIEIDNVEIKLCKIGLWCIQMRPSDRPSMNKVIEMLESDADTVDMPPKPFLFSSPTLSRRNSSNDFPLTEISTIYENDE